MKSNNQLWAEPAWILLFLAFGLSGCDGKVKLDEADKAEPAPAVSIPEKSDQVENNSGGRISQPVNAAIDTTAPVAGTFSTSTSITDSGFQLNWSVAKDAVTAQSALEYFVCSGANAAAIDTAAKCKAASQELDWSAGATSHVISGKASQTTYYYNVVVRDAVGNETVYPGITQSTTLSSPTKFTKVGCIDPDLTMLAADQQVSLCDGTLAQGTASVPDMSNLTAPNIRSGVTIAGVVGTNIQGGAACSAGGQVGCTASPSFSAISADVVAPENLRSTSSAGSGNLKYCRAGYNLSVMDLPNAYANMHYYGRTFTANATDLLTIGKAKTFMQALGSVTVRVSTTGTLPGGLVAGTTYYSIWVSDTTIKLATSSTDASTGTGIDITDAGTGTHRIYVVGDGVAQYWDVLDDINSTNATRGNWFTNSYFGSENLCGASDWQILAPSANGSTIVPGSAADCDATSDDCMIQDKLTGEIWTEVNPGGSGGSLTWAESIGFCNDLSFGGFTDWRLPTHKEFLQGNVNGLYFFDVNYPQSGDANGFFRTATFKSKPSSGFNHVYWIHGNGGSQADNQHNTTQFSAAYRLRCVRN